MSLLYINCFLAAVVFAFSFYIDVKIVNTKRIASFCTCVTCVLLLLAMATTFTLSGKVQLAALLFQVFVIVFLFSLFLLIRLALFYPNEKKSGASFPILLLLIAASSVFSFMLINGLTYDPPVGLVLQYQPYEVAGISVFPLVMHVMVIGAPLLCMLLFFVRSFIVKGAVLRFQMRLIALSLLVFLVIGLQLFYYGAHHPRSFWLQPLAVGFAYTVLSFCLIKITQITILPGKKVLFGRFTAMVVAVAVTGGIYALLVTSLVRTSFSERFPGLFFLIAVAAMSVLFYAMVHLRRLLVFVLRARTEYQNDLEAALSGIDYAVGSEIVMATISDSLKKYVDVSSIDIIVESEGGQLQPKYSTRERGLRFSENQMILNFLLNKNIQVMIYSQVRSDILYAECRKELLAMFEELDAEVIIVVQESHRIIGLFILGKKMTGSGYTEYDFKTLRNLHSYFFLIVYYLKNIANESVVSTVDRELQYSGQVINAIQENVDHIEDPKVEVSYISRSARNLGGDFIDFIRLAPERHLFIMGDVSGKGLNASMSMVILKSVIRTFLQETTDFKELVCKVNGFIKRNLPKGTFFAGVFGLFDFSENIMYYINCGIPAMFLYTDVYNNAVEIQGDGRILGFAKDVSKYLKVKKIVLNPDDILLMTTDGIIDSESLRGEPFGKTRIQKYLLDNRTYPAERITQFLFENFIEFTSRELSDDITLLAIKYREKN